MQAMSKKLPLPKISKHTIASDNLNKVVVETSARTKRDYHKRFFGMYNKRSHGDQFFSKTPTTYQVIDLMIGEIEEKRKNGSLKHSSLRQYKATLNYALTYMAAMKNQDTSVSVPPAQKPFYKQLADNISVDEINKLSTRVLTWGDEDSEKIRALDRRATAKNHTSTAKMKGFPEAIFKDLMSDNHSGRYWLREFIYFNLRFGLRPKEWQHAKLLSFDDFKKEYSTLPDTITPTTLNIGAKYLKEDELSSVEDTMYTTLPYVMVVKNAKATHGRACGEYRYVHFFASESEYQRLIQLTEFLQHRAEISKANIPAGVEDTYELAVFKPLQKQLYHYLKKYKPTQILKEIHQKQLKLYEQYVKKRESQGATCDLPKPTFKRPTLYSTRHQAIANAKADGYTPLQIAALFGHISMNTASLHYAHKSVGNSGKTKLAPNPANMELILMALDDISILTAEKVYNKSHEQDFDMEPMEPFEPQAEQMVKDIPKSSVQSNQTNQSNLDDRQLNNTVPSPTDDGPKF